MLVEYRPFRHPFHPHCVTWDHAYDVIDMYHNGGMSKTHHYRIKSHVKDWLEGDQCGPVKFKTLSGPLMFGPVANGKKIVRVWHKPSPPIRFRNKGDALIMKLTLGGV